jgi:pseudouridine synthase
VLVRLQKFLAEAGIGSRRHCETLITAGKVSVNGQPVTQLGTKIDPGADRVIVAGKTVAAERKLYIALHKPAGVVCTNRDTHGRPRAIDLVPVTLGRLYTVGRLDQDSEGLLLLTNDGTFSLRLTHPRYKMPKTYWVQVEGGLTRAAAQRLLAGIVTERETLRADAISNLQTHGAVTELELVLREGKKRQIRRMMAVLGHPVRRLVRVAIGPIILADLKPAQWRHLTDEEVDRLTRDTT